MLPSLRSHDEYIKLVQQNLNDDTIPKAHDANLHHGSYMEYETIYTTQHSDIYS